MENVAKDTLGYPAEQKWESADEEVRFRSLFCTLTKVITTLWESVKPKVDCGVEENHVLFLFFW